MKPWKLAEKEVARYFGGVRRSRVSYGERIGDIIHPDYSIEVKWGKQIPMYCRTKEAVILESDEGKYYLLEWSKQDKKRYNLAGVRCISLKSTKFLDDCFAQAMRYNGHKEPIVCLKPKSSVGFVIAWELQVSQASR